MLDREAKKRSKPQQSRVPWDPKNKNRTNKSDEWVKKQSLSLNGVAASVHWATVGLSMGNLPERESDVGCYTQQTASFLVITSW